MMTARVNGEEDPQFEENNLQHDHDCKAIVFNTNGFNE